MSFSLVKTVLLSYTESFFILTLTLGLPSRTLLSKPNQIMCSSEIKYVSTFNITLVGMVSVRVYQNFNLIAIW